MPCLTQPSMIFNRHVFWASCNHLDAFLGHLTTILSWTNMGRSFSSGPHDDEILLLMMIKYSHLSGVMRYDLIILIDDISI